MQKIETTKSKENQPAPTRGEAFFCFFFFDFLHFFNNSGLNPQKSK